ncbi:MAG: DUF5678 domain-containing protein [Candidatus Bathyarchaeia archaeon]|jgi:hypothetical protein
MKELVFHIADAYKINRKYGWKHITIVDDKVVSSGSDPKEGWEMTKKKYPSKQPVLAFVPKEDTLVLSIGPFESR